MLKWNLMSLYWVVGWFGLGFGVPESWALISGHSENTLSYQVWHLEGLGLKGFGSNPLDWSAGHYFVAAGMLWLLMHFVYHVWH